MKRLPGSLLPSTFYLLPLLFLSTPGFAFVRTYPILGADFLLGQHFFEGDPSAWGGNLDLRVIPAVKFSETFVFIPSLLVSYQGTKDVSELAGGAQLFQDSLKTSLNLKPVWQRGRVRLKPSLGYRMDFLRETRDESLGRGLFDFRKTALGLEAEYVFNPRQWASVGLDYYTIRFPHYSSLESQAGAGLGRENEGARVLDSNNLSVSGAWDTDLPWPSTRGRFTAALLAKDYPDQHVVDAAGQLEASQRKDSVLSYGGQLAWSRAAGGVEATVSADFDQLVVGSNQNHYDARLARFLDDYYGYQETAFRPGLELRIPKKGSLLVTYALAERLYFKRPIQDEGGAYLGEHARVKARTLTAELAVPLRRHFKALARSVLTGSSSNQRYEKVYRYNYNISSHFLGISYEY